MDILVREPAAFIRGQIVKKLVLRVQNPDGNAGQGQRVVRSPGLYGERTCSHICAVLLWINGYVLSYSAQNPDMNGTKGALPQRIQKRNGSADAGKLQAA